ncbi:MAG: cysteine--tRNA ligase [Parcubacteria group bacterium]
MLKLYNTLAKTKEEFKPVVLGKVGLYSCGPTVYNYIHIGNIRAYLNADILRRYLIYCGYEVRHIKNITDVGHLTEDDIAQGDSGEDKISKKAGAENKTPEEIARFYEDAFKKDEELMDILPANYFPRATAHVPAMIKMIEGLIKKGFAYEKNGNVFFDVTKFNDYGKLSGNTLANLKVGARLEEHPDKKNPWDFALWLAAPKEHLMKWVSPWGEGYPGWHIECSAMSMEYLGDTVDIHTGGEDNIFPHHEAEIAQSECFSGKKFVNFWLHNRHLLVNGEKMSKSKGNFYILKDILDKNYSPMELRLALLSSHYRSQMNFTWEVMEQAKSNLQKISAWVNNLKNIESRDAINRVSTGDGIDFVHIYEKRFEEAIDDDLNIPLALSVVYELITETNKFLAEDKLSIATAENILKFWEKINKVLGLKVKIFVTTTFTLKRNIGDVAISNFPEEIIRLAEKRKVARDNKDFQKSDELRKEIEKAGYIIEDLKDNNYKLTKK